MKQFLSFPETLKRSYIFGVGIDLANTYRFPPLLLRYGSRFLDRVYHPNEIVIIKNLISETKYENAENYMASRWAVKEACHKALSSAKIRLLFPSIEVVSHTDTSPTLVFMKDAHEKLASMGLQIGASEKTLDKSLTTIQPHLSLSHDDGIAGAICIFTVESPAKRIKHELL